MNVKLQPRGIMDKGGYACMPLRKNIPVGRKDWSLTVCPECGRECWAMPYLKIAKMQGAAALCTECALRKAVT